MAQKGTEWEHIYVSGSAKKETRYLGDFPPQNNIQLGGEQEDDEFI